MSFVVVCERGLTEALTTGTNILNKRASAHCCDNQPPFYQSLEDKRKHASFIMRGLSLIQLRPASLNSIDWRLRLVMKIMMAAQNFVTKLNT
jgi:hypothetical protein